MALKTLKPAATPAQAPDTSNPQADGVAALQAQVAALQAQAAALQAKAPPGPEPLTATVEPEPQAQAVAVPAPQAQAQAVAAPGAVNPLMALFATAGLTVSGAGSAARALSKPGGKALVLPTIDISSGNTGGSFSACDRNDPAVLRALPQGRVPLFGLFLAYRYEVAIWPCDFDNKQDDTRPAADGVITSSDEDNAELLSTFGEAYQFTAKVERCNKFDPPTGPGHPRPSFQALVYLPPNPASGWQGGLVVIRTPYHAMSVSRSADSIIRHNDAASNSIAPFACQFEVRTNQETNKAGTQTWKIHHLDFQAMPFPGAQAEQVLIHFRDWFVKLDVVQKQVYNDWCAGKDSPMTAVLHDLLVRGAALRTRR
jgi:hypothetical protein